MVAVWVVDPGTVTEQSAPTASDADNPSITETGVADLLEEPPALSTQERAGFQDAAREDRVAESDVPKVFDEALPTIPEERASTPNQLARQDAIAPAASAVAEAERAAREIGVQSLDSRGRAAPGERDRFEAALAAEIMAPDDSTRWRLTTNGGVEHSSDGGASWRLQWAGIGRVLTGGSAPTARVCWLIGDAGTVARTTDGGESWERVPAPTRAAIVTIDATDAQTATISDATTASFRTVDGGATWTQTDAPIR